MYTIYLVSYSQQDFVGAGSRYHLSGAHHSPYEIWVHRWRRNAPWMETLGVLAGINSWVKMGRLSVIRPRNIYEVLVWSWSYGATNWVEGWRVEGWRVEGLKGWRVEGRAVRVQGRAKARIFELCEWLWMSSESARIFYVSQSQSGWYCKYILYCLDFSPSSLN